MALTFIGPRPEGKYLCHKDGNPTNDHLENLCWTSRSEVERRAIERGKVYPRGEDHWTAKLTNAQAKEIREKSANGTSSQDLADEYNVSRATIGYIVQGRTYRTAGGPVRESKGRLPESAILAIRFGRDAGIPLKTLARLYKVSESYVSKIANKKRRKDVVCL